MIIAFDVISAEIVKDQLARTCLPSDLVLYSKSNFLTGDNKYFCLKISFFPSIFVVFHYVTYEQHEIDK